MRELRFRPSAEIDLDQIWDHTVETWGNAKAEKYIRNIQRLCEGLLMNPEQGRDRAEVQSGIRSHVIGEHVVFYRFDDKCVDVVRILHQRMDVESQL